MNVREQRERRVAVPSGWYLGTVIVTPAMDSTWAGVSMPHLSAGFLGCEHPFDLRPWGISKGGVYSGDTPGLEDARSMAALGHLQRINGSCAESAPHPIAPRFARRGRR